MVQNLQASGWLNLFADSMHNFTDGIAVGVSFATGEGIAIATFLSIIIHEIPHEVGDFTILVQSGLSKYEAIQAQFVTAIAAFLGTGVGLYMSEHNEVMQDVLLSLTAGGFLYIATVAAMNQMILASSQHSESFLQIFGEVVCFSLGVSLMLLVTFLE